ncbi:MAG: DUF4221 family protein [Bacteroidota bacterium]
MRNVIIQSIRVYVLLGLFLFVCCKEEKRDLSLNFISDYKIPLRSGGLSMIPDWKIVNYNNESYFAYHHVYDHHIEVYDLYKKEFSYKIPYETEGPDKIRLLDFDLFEDKVILVGRNNIMLVNKEGQVLRKYSNYPNKENSLRGIEYDEYSIRIGNNLRGDVDYIDAENQFVYTPIFREDISALEEAFFQTQVLAYQLDMNEGNTRPLNISYPDDSEQYGVLSTSHFFSSYLLPYLCLAENRYIFYNFPFSSFVGKYDIEAGRVERSAAINSKFTSNAISPFSEDLSKREGIRRMLNKEVSFGPVVHDPYQSLCYRKHLGTKEEDKEDIPQYFTVFDERLNKKGEVKLPEHLSRFNYAPTKEGIYFSLAAGYNPSEDTIYLKLYELKQ